MTNNTFLGTLNSCGRGEYGPVVSAWVESAKDVTLTASNVSISGNYIWNSQPPTMTASGGGNTIVYNGHSDERDGWTFGTNTYDDPGLTNPDSLPTGPPDCTGHTTTVSCMNAKYNVYSLIKPTIATTSVGYQPPAPCTPDPNYPQWLKGIVHLHWDGMHLAEVDGLVTKPCGL